VSARVYEFGPFRLDADKAVLWHHGEIVSLTPKALALLHVLVEARGDVVPKDDLMARVWPAVERALECDPDHAAAHAVAAWIVLFRDWDWDAARRALERALEADPVSGLAAVVEAFFHSGVPEGWLTERAAEDRDPWIVFLGADGALAALRGEERFDRLVDRIHGRG
jgi:hypothetical protein